MVVLFGLPLLLRRAVHLTVCTSHCSPATDNKRRIYDRYGRQGLTQGGASAPTFRNAEDLFRQVCLS